MNQKPIYFNLLSILLIGVAGSFPLQIIWFFDYQVADLDMVLGHLTVLNWAVVILCCMTALLIWQVNKLMIPFGFLLLATVFFNNYMVGKYNLQFDLLTTSAASVLFGVPLLFVFQKKYLKIIMNPGLRWWRTSKRTDLYLKGRLAFEDDFKTSLQVSTINISETGVLLTVFDSENTLLKKIEESTSAMTLCLFLGENQLKLKRVREYTDMAQKQVCWAFRFEHGGFFKKLLWQNRLNFIKS